MNNYSRICKQCNCEILYKTKSQYNDAIRKDRICKLCSNKNNGQKNKIIYSGSLIKKCNHCNMKHTFSGYKQYNRSKPNNVYLCKSCALKKTHTAKFVSEDTRKLISESTKNAWRNGKHRNTVKKSSERWLGKNNPMYNSSRIGSLNPFYKKQHSEQTINYLSEINKKENLSKNKLKKMSKSAKNRVKRLGMPSVNYNREACKIIDDYGKKHGYNFQHAENGGECKIKSDNTYYFVDGYDKEKNVVIEYYEKAHKGQRERDVMRKQKIVDILNCEFIELWYDDFE
jgi:hypothetical protein